MHKPRESDARKEGVIHACLQRLASVGLGRSVPHRSQCSGGRILDGGVEDSHVALDLIPSRLNLIAKTEVQGEIWSHLEIILNKQLRQFHTGTELRRDACLPVLRLTKQEVRIGQSG